MISLSERVRAEVLKAFSQAKWPDRKSHRHRDQLYITGCQSSVQDLLLELDTPGLLRFLTQVRLSDVDRVSTSTDLLFDQDQYGQSIVTNKSEALIRRVAQWFCCTVGERPHQRYEYQSSTVDGLFIVLNMFFNQTHSIYCLFEPILHGGVVPAQDQPQVFLALATDVYNIMYLHSVSSPALVQIFKESVQLVSLSDVMTLKNDCPDCYSIRLALYWRYNNITLPYPDGFVAPHILHELIGSVELDPTYTVSEDCDTVFRLLIDMSLDSETGSGFLPQHLSKLLCSNV